MLKEIIWALPAYIDRWRIVPRAMIFTYLWLLVEVSIWFMGLPIPNASQAGFASAVLGVGMGWFGLYLREPAKKLDG